MTPSKEIIPQRMYLILREELSFKYIQGAHALAQYGLEFPDNFKEWDNQHLICLSVFDGKTLKEEIEKLCWDDGTPKWKMSVFYEPDLESTLPTAVAIWHDGVTNEVPNALRHLRMATK